MLAGVDVTALVPLSTFQLSVGVLSAAIVFESWAFLKANTELQRQIDEYDWNGIREAFRETSDVTTLTAFTEDAVALGGAGIALVGVVASHYTGNEVYDAVTAVLIGALLMGFAVALAWENKRLLLGESLDAAGEDRLREAVTECDGVAGVDSLRSMFVGPQVLLVTADVTFDDGLDTTAIEDRIDDIETALTAADERVSMVYVEPEQ